MKFVFLSKDGGIDQREVSKTGDSYPKTYTARACEPSDKEVYKLARGIFDRKHSKEAIVRGEGNVAKAMQVFWDKTKIDSRATCLQEAKEILSLSAEDRVYQLLRDTNAPGGLIYVERGTVLVDLSKSKPKASSDDYIFLSGDYSLPKITERGKKSSASVLSSGETKSEWTELKSKRDWDSVLDAEDEFNKALAKDSRF